MLISLPRRAQLHVSPTQHKTNALGDCLELLRERTARPPPPAVGSAASSFPPSLVAGEQQLAPSIQNVLLRGCGGHWVCFCLRSTSERGSRASASLFQLEIGAVCSAAAGGRVCTALGQGRGEKDGAGHGWRQLPAGRGEPGSAHLDFFLQNEQDIISQIPGMGRISLFLRDG